MRATRPYHHVAQRQVKLTISSHFPTWSVSCRALLLYRAPPLLGQSPLIPITTQFNAKWSSPSLLTSPCEACHAPPLLSQSTHKISHQTSPTSLRVKTPQASTLMRTRPSSQKESPSSHRPLWSQSCRCRVFCLPWAPLRCRPPPVVPRPRRHHHRDQVDEKILPAPRASHLDHRATLLLVSTSAQDAPPSPIAVCEPLASPYPKSRPPPPGLALRPLPTAPHRRQPPGSADELLRRWRREKSPVLVMGRKAETSHASLNRQGRAHLHSVVYYFPFDLFKSIQFKFKSGLNFGNS
jgi:hypothetical protein